MTVDVIIPWRPGCPHRERALAFVTARYREAGYPVTVAKTDPSAPWVKAAAVTPAADASSADLLVIADADVWCDGLPDAIDHCTTWAIPHRHVRRLTPEATCHVYDDGDFGGALAEKSYVGKMGGGLVVIRRDLYLDTPLDPRYVGWGREDESWGYALTVLYGHPWRGDLPLWHLWHPPQDRPSRTRGSATSEDLFDRYRRARRPNDMRQLVHEAKAVTPCH